MKIKQIIKDTIKEYFSPVTSISKPKSIPKYILEPDQYGTYTLKQWQYETEWYLAKAYYVTPEEADTMIKSLERKTLHYREE